MIRSQVAVDSRYPVNIYHRLSLVKWRHQRSLLNATSYGRKTFVATLPQLRIAVGLCAQLYFPCDLCIVSCMISLSVIILRGAEAAVIVHNSRMPSPSLKLHNAIVQEH